MMKTTWINEPALFQEANLERKFEKMSNEELARKAYNGREPDEVQALLDELVQRIIREKCRANFEEEMHHKYRRLFLEAVQSREIAKK